MESKFIYLLFLISFHLLKAQVPNPLKFFPHNEIGYPDTVQNFNIKDSVDAAGNIYITQFARNINPIQYPYLFSDTTTYMIDTAYNVFGTAYVSGAPDFIYFKLNASQGDQWVLHTYQDSTSVYGYEMARVQDVWEDELFYGSGIYTTLKAYVYYYAFDSTHTDGLGRYGNVLAYGFGLWSSGGGDLFGSILLKGCVIDGILYGDTTNVITSVKDLSKSLLSEFELYPNYPNPFNPNTTIEYELFSQSHIKLMVFNSLGELIETLVDQDQSQGKYKVNFSAEHFSTGVYLYRLTNGIQSLTNKMVVIK